MPSGLFRASLSRGARRGGQALPTSFKCGLHPRYATLKAQGEDDPIAWSAAHRRFHEAVFAACGSPWLLRVLDTLYDHSERYRTVTVQRGTEDAEREHHDIYAAAIQRDKTAALEALRRHIAGTVGLLKAKATTP